MPQIENPASPLVPQLEGVHFFGFDGAPCSQRVSFALAEKGLRRARKVRWDDDRPATRSAPADGYVWRPVSLIKKQHLTDAYAAIQPNMVVPALVHDGRLYVESMDIVRYLDETWAQNPLLPTEPARVALTEELVALGIRLHVAVRYVSFHWGLGRIGKIGESHVATVRRLEQNGSPEQLAAFYARFNRDEIDEATFLGHLRDLEQGWGEQEARLADGRPFLTGDTFTKADIIWAIKVLRIFECGYPFAENFPRLDEWFGRIRRREGFRAGVMNPHRLMSNAFRVKAAIERLLGGGIARASRAAA